MMQDCASSNKIKENKYKILRMSLLLGSDEDREETINNFEDAAREIDAMNDEIYLKDLEDKFYDTLKLEEEEKKLSVLVDYIGGRVEQRISLLSDFANVTGFDLTNLPPIKYYDKLDDYKERLKYIREYLDNTKQIEKLNKEIEEAEEKLKKAYMDKATSEECNNRNEEILLNKFKNIVKSIDDFHEIDEDNVDKNLNNIIDQVQESKKSLDIFTKSFTTLSGSGISEEEEEEYLSYVNNAKEVYYTNKEREYLLRIYKLLLKKEIEYSNILNKREEMNDILYERINLRKELGITEIDILNNLYDLLERQYEDIKRQAHNMNDIELLTEEISSKKDQVNELELDNQKVEILALLREFCMIDTYSDDSDDTTTEESTEEVTIPEEINPVLPDESSPVVDNIFMNHSTEEEPSSRETSNKEPISNNIFDQSNNVNQSLEQKKPIEEEVAKDNQVVAVEPAKNIDLDLVHFKANKVMQRVGEMLGIKSVETKIVSVSNEPGESKEEILAKVEEEKIPVQNDLPENPLFSNNILTEEKKEEPTLQTTPDPEDNSFWFPSDTPDALNELPDLPEANDNFFANNSIPDLNFPDLKINFGNNDTEGTE